MRKFIYIILLFSFFAHSQEVLRVSSSGRVLNGRVFSFGSVAPITPSVSIAATDATATEESTTTGTFTVTLSSASVGTTPVNYTVSGTATSGSDYISIGTSVNILDGQTTATISVTPIDDATEESTETVIVTLASGSGYTVGGPSSATINITDNDTAVAGNANWFDASPSVSEPADGTTYIPTSQADITNAANAGKTAIISSSFSCSGCTFAANQKIRPAGGVISGTNINLNGAYIDDVADQAFASTTTFTTVYEDSWVYAETFGAVGNDATDDSASVDALLDNVKFGKLGLNQTYVKNSPSFSDGTRQIILDMNGSKFDVTSDAGYDETTDQQAMFMFHGANVKFFNGEIDGNDLFGAVFRIGHPQAYHFEDLWIHNLENEPYSTSSGIRVIAFLFHVSNADGSKSWQGGIPWTSRSTTNVFENGYINNCTIEDLNATGTGLPSLSAQAMWWVIGGVNNTNNALAYQSNNVIRRITGGESEGLYWNGGVGITPDHALAIQVQNDSILDCGDRAMKATSSNITLKNNYFGRINPAIATDQGGGLVDIFTLNNFSNPSNRVKNVTITDNTFSSPYSNNAKLLVLGDVNTVSVTGNTFTQTSSGNLAGLSLGTINQTGGQGGVDNATIQNNSFVNSHVDFLYAFLPTNFLFDTNTFTHTHTSGGNNGAAIFRHDNSTAIDGSGGFTVSNLTINVTISGVNFNGIFNSNGSFTNTTWDNIDLNYASTYSTTNGEFGRFYNSASFDSSNTISNCTMSNALGTGSLVVDGADQSVVITNSFDDASPTPNAITVQ